jgi:hypothetical protein
MSAGAMRAVVCHDRELRFDDLFEPLAVARRRRQTRPIRTRQDSGPSSR